jgi:integrase
MAVNITETAISAAAKKAATDGVRVELIDKVQPGLRLRVSPAGAKTWVLTARDADGRMRRFTLGHHPGMGAADARNEARRLRADVRRGADPVKETRERRALAKAATDGVATFGALLDLYETKQGSKLKSWPEYRRRMEDVFKPLLNRPLTSLEPRDFQLRADSWPSPQSASSAVRYVRPLLKWGAAAGRGYVPRSLAEIVPPASVQRRDRVLSRLELARLLPLLKPDHGVYPAALRFLLLTAARRSEVAQARWRDVDMATGVWTIPVTKNRKPHAVPLSRQALALLEALRPADASGDALIFSATGRPLDGWDRATKAIQGRSATEGWTRHDLRRTAATMMGEAGVEPHVIEAALNHTSIHSQLAATYNRARYREPVARALQTLADLLDGIEQGGAAVIPMRQER